MKPRSFIFTGEDESKQRKKNGIFTVIGGFLYLFSISNMFFSFVNLYTASYYYSISPTQFEVFTTINYTPIISAFTTLFALLTFQKYIFKIGEKKSLFIFGIMNSIITFSLAFVKNVYLFIFIFGILQGAIFGCVYMVPSIISWSYMPSSRGLATGIIFMGLSISPYLFGNLSILIVNPQNDPPNVQIHYSHYTYYLFDAEIAENVPKMYMIIAAVQFGIVLLSIIFLKSNYDPKIDLETQEENAMAQSITLSNITIIKGDGMVGSAYEKANLKKSTVILAESVIVPEFVNENTKPNEFWKKALCSCNLIPIIITNFFTAQYVCFLNLNFKLLGIAFGHSDHFITELASYGFLIAAIGKVTIGIIYDKFSYRFSYKLILILEMIVTASIYPLLSSDVGICIEFILSYAIYGFLLGYYPIISQNIFGLNQGAKAYALVYFGFNFANLVGGTFAAYLLSLFGYKFIFVYFFVLISMAYLIFSLYQPELQTTIDRLKSILHPQKM